MAPMLSTATAVIETKRLFKIMIVSLLEAVVIIGAAWQQSSEQNQLNMKILSFLAW